MTGNGRNLALLKTIPVVAETVLVPVLRVPMRDDNRDRIQSEQIKEAS